MYGVSGCKQLWYSEEEKDPFQRLDEDPLDTGFLDTHEGPVSEVR